MSDRLPRISGKKMRKLLEADGFIQRSGKGSHTYYKHPDGRTTLVSGADSETLVVTLIGKILRDIGMSHDEYRDRVDSL